MIFLHILIYNLTPIALIVAVGIILQRIFRLDIHTLSKLNFYLFSPAIIFKMLYETDMSYTVMGQVLLFFFIFILTLYGAAEIVVRLRRYDGGMASAFRNSVLFYNSANYAIPLNQLVFHGNPFTMSVQIIIMMMQAMLPHTYGIYSVNSHKGALKGSMRAIFSMPVLYAIPLALLLRGFAVPIPESVKMPIDYAAEGFLAVALVTLGAQLGTMKWAIKITDVFFSCLLRLCVAPALGALIVWLMGFEGLMAQALILSCAVPTSLNSMLLAVEFRNEPEFSSQAVLASTVMSMLTVTLVIFLLQV